MDHSAASQNAFATSMYHLEKVRREARKVLVQAYLARLRVLEGKENGVGELKGGD
jgi:hypothetical protein